MRSSRLRLIFFVPLICMHVQGVRAQSRAANPPAQQAAPSASAVWLECTGVFFGRSAANKEDWKQTYLIMGDNLFSYSDETLTFVLHGNADVIQGDDNSGSFHQRVELDRRTGLLTIDFTNAGPVRHVVADCHAISPPLLAPRF